MLMKRAQHRQQQQQQQQTLSQVAVKSLHHCHLYLLCQRALQRQWRLQQLQPLQGQSLAHQSSAQATCWAKD
jgi:hypothetical protein